MALAKSNYLENAILDHVLDNTSYTSPTTVYLALFTTDPTDADAGSEVTGGSYARVALSFAAATGGVSATNTDTVFSNLPVAVITHAGIYDATTTGNLLYHGALDSTISTTSGSDITFTAGDITVTET